VGAPRTCSDTTFDAFDTLIRGQVQDGSETTEAEPNKISPTPNTEAN
jgi:hypothetical protein